MAPSAILLPSLVDETSKTASKLDIDSTPLTTSKHAGHIPAPEPMLLHRSLKEEPYNVISASGIFLNLKNGRKIIDACGGAAVAIIGHGNEEVIQATTAQMMKVSYVHTLSYTTDSAEDLAKCLLDGNSCKCSKTSSAYVKRVTNMRTIQMDSRKHIS